MEKFPSCKNDLLTRPLGLTKDEASLVLDEGAVWTESVDDVSLDSLL